jgi:hypothetical protein
VAIKFPGASRAGNRVLFRVVTRNGADDVPNCLSREISRLIS